MNSTFYNRYKIDPMANEPEKRLSKPASIQEGIDNISSRYGADFYQGLGALVRTLAGKEFSINTMDSAIDNLMKLKEDLTKKYLFSLLFPEKSKGTRIPSKFPVPSATFQQTDFLLITPNALGNFEVQWSPQNLSISNANYEITYDVAPGLNGISLDTIFYSTSTLTSPLATNWQAFRVVSACMIVQYIGSFINLSGTFGGGLDITTQYPNNWDPNYSNFSNVDDRLWSQVVRVDEGLKVVYFPKDYSDFNFIKPNQAPNSGNSMSSSVKLIVYGQNLPPNVSCVRIDFIKNVEAIPGPAFADIVELGFSSSKNNSEHALDAAKMLTTSNSVITRLVEQEELENVMKTKGADYKNIFDNINLVGNKDMTSVIKNIRTQVANNNKKINFGESNSLLDQVVNNFELASGSNAEKRVKEIIKKNPNSNINDFSLTKEGYLRYKGYALEPLTGF